MTKLTEFEIEAGYEALAQAVNEAFRFGELALTAKTVLDEAVAEALLDGKLDGKNETQREAQARRLLVDEYQASDMPDARARVARRDLELARLRVDSIRARLRLAEVLAQAQGAAG